MYPQLAQKDVKSVEFESQHTTIGLAWIEIFAPK